MRHFVGIGVDQYTDPQLGRLGFCSNDARVLGEVLASHGYAVATLHDAQANAVLRPTFVNISAALTRLVERNFGHHDFLWVHFSCHGMLANDDKAYLLFADSQINDLDHTALAVNDVADFMSGSGARRWLLTLDACHAGIKPVAGGVTQETDPEFIHNVYDMAMGKAVFAASTAAEKAADTNSGRHGVFTQAILDALGSFSSARADKTMFTVDDLKDQVIDRVRRWSSAHLGTGEPQDPSFRIEATGDLVVLDFRTS